VSALAVDDLTVRFVPGQRPAVDRFALTVGDGEIVGLVGESGCGKSTLALAVMGLLPSTAEVTGSVLVGDRQVVGADDRALRSLRGRAVAMVFQDPSTSLDPTWPVGDQVAEAVRAHRRVGRREARAAAVALMSDVGIPSAAARYGDRPHQLSGGMRQRIVVAAALANAPTLLVADEPTTALDVTIQAQILTLVRRLREDRGTSVLLISHDLGVVAQVCDRVGVMYAGELVELADVRTLFAAPRHPYTRALLDALPSSGRSRLAVIGGQVPSPGDLSPGCRFAPRCSRRTDRCAVAPALTATSPTAQVACWHPHEGPTA
jgi:peptide/nickel transport system ATP-binding protein